MSTALLTRQARGVRGDNDPATKKMRMTYIAETSFKVELQYRRDDPDDWEECFETGPIKLPPMYYLGLSAETGDLSDNHDIIGISSSNLHLEQRPDGSKAASAPIKAHPYNPGGQRERGSWRWFLLKVVLFAIALVGAYVGWTVYRANRRGSRF